MCCEQLQAICNDETAVEQAKKQGSHRLNISKKALLAEVFGKGKVASFLWLILFKIVGCQSLTLVSCLTVYVCINTVAV